MKERHLDQPATVRLRDLRVAGGKVVGMVGQLDAFRVHVEPLIGAHRLLLAIVVEVVDSDTLVTIVVELRLGKDWLASTDIETKLCYLYYYRRRMQMSTSVFKI